jgi:hypothetical protein
MNKLLMTPKIKNEIAPVEINYYCRPGRPLQKKVRYDFGYGYAMGFYRPIDGRQLI